MTRLIFCVLSFLLVSSARAAEPVDAFADVNRQMHHAMMIEPTGDVDVDFIRGMIPHHQGAVDMAKIELQKGRDPEARKLARQIIESQEKEIKWMNDWLAKHGAPQAAPAHSRH